MELKLSLPPVLSMQYLGHRCTHLTSVSTKGKLGYTVIEGNWGLLMGVLVQRAITGGGSYKGPAQELCEAAGVLWSRQLFQEIVCSFPLQTESLLTSSTCFFRVYWCLTLKVIDIKCLREWWEKEVIILVVKGKGMCLLGSRKNVSSFSFSMAERERDALFLWPHLLLLLPTQRQVFLSLLSTSATSIASWG